MVLVVAEMVIVAMILFFCHRVLGYAFNSKKEIVDRIADMVPFLCLSIIMDGLQAVLSVEERKGSLDRNGDKASKERERIFDGDI
ncbi:hypothetical protein SO802_024814 [Lithocarpus litseifolius]|uniref:Uncharacterized protein n=1 Tax=Lithocarpus litseifolius TaxID=425828 RepID=A0AAW2CBF0_9ROSI